LQQFKTDIGVQIKYRHWRYKLKRAKERAAIKEPRETGVRVEPALFEEVAEVDVAAGAEDELDVDVEVVLVREFWNSTPVAEVTAELEKFALRLILLRETDRPETKGTEEAGGGAGVVGGGTPVPAVIVNWGLYATFGARPN
jgi:hypothetical protein